MLTKLETELLAALKATGGVDGFLLGQAATFIGGACDAYKMIGANKEQAETYFETLHKLCEANRVLIAKAEAQDKKSNETS